MPGVERRHAVLGLPQAMRAPDAMKISPLWEEVGLKVQADRFHRGVSCRGGTR